MESSLTETEGKNRNYQGVIQPTGFPPLPENWVSEWETYQGACQKLQVFSVLHHAKDWKSPRAVVLLHGLNEHGGRYLHVPHYLKDVVDAVYLPDLRGHGRSEGLRGHCANFNHFSEDLVIAIRRLDDQLKKRFGASEIHLVAHSFGGLVALNALFDHTNLPIHSVTLSAPLLGIAVKIPPLKKLAAVGLSKIWGSLHMLNEIDPSVLSHDKAVLEAHVADRLVHKKITPSLFVKMQGAIEVNAKKNAGIQYPFQMVVPLQDKVVNPEPALAFFRSLKHRDKRLKTYPDFFHEPMNEIGKEIVFEDIASWIRLHSPSLQGKV